MALEAIKYSRGHLKVLNQKLLPLETEYEDVKTAQDGWEAIRHMKVRGAPAIAILGTLSLAVELTHKHFNSKEELLKFIKDKLQYLETARPTAVNMKEASDRLSKLTEMLCQQTTETADTVKERLIVEAEAMMEKDVSDNRRMGLNGAQHILKHCNEEHVRVLTHCNTGSLATAGYGTALGVIRALHGLNRLEHVYCTETRPYNQGSRLTAYELMHDKIPATLIADSAVSMALKEKKISVVIVGADRVVANGDTANKIGTFQIAIAAKYLGIPFYIAAPTTTIDLNLKNGDEIIIEERHHAEITTVKGIKIAAPGTECWNPAFDVTPKDLITGGIITEYGVFSPAQLKARVEGFVDKKQRII